MKRYLIAILLLSAILRWWQIEQVPPSPSLDEVSLGYNAYSILKTGHDEYGERLPLILRAYDDFRPAGYVYLIIPFVKLLGLNVLAVRLPSAILGVLTVFLTYFLVKELFWGRASSSKLSAVSAFLLAISPWHIYLSRLGHEVNAGLFTTVAGVYFFLRYLREQKWWLVASAIMFALTFFTYQSQKVVTPILVAGLGLIYLPQLKKRLSHLFWAAAVAILVALPIITISFSPEALTRFRGTSVFSDSSLYEEARLRQAQARLRGDLVGQIVDSRKVTTLKIFFSQYLSHFEPLWLFSGGPRESHKVPSLGLFYWWEAPFIVWGLWQLLRKSAASRCLVLLWLFVAPLPAALTTQAPHAMRSFTMLPTWQILEGLGLVSLVRNFSPKVMAVVAALGTVTIVSSLVVFWYQYFVVFPRQQSDSFQYALARTIPWVKQHQEGFAKVVFSNQGNLYQSYMFFLFFSRFDPKLYWQLGGTESGGFNETHAFGKYEFRPLRWSADSGLRQTLLVGNPVDFPEGVAKLAQFTYLDGSVGVVAVAP